MINELPVEDNFTLWTITCEQLMSLDPQPWSGQRDLNPDVVSTLVEAYSHNIKTYGKLLIRHPFYLATINQKYQILDGQHRYQALCQIREQNPTWPFKFRLPVGFIECTDHNDFEREFLILNWIRPQSKVHIKSIKQKSTYSRPRPVKQTLIDEVSIIIQAMGILCHKYENISDRLYRPTINKSFLQDEIHDHKLISKLNIPTVEELVNSFDKLNQFYVQKPISYFIDIISKVESVNAQERLRTEKYITDLQKSHETKHMLGVFKSKPVYSRFWMAHLMALNSSDKVI